MRRILVLAAVPLLLAGCSPAGPRGTSETDHPTGRPSGAVPAPAPPHATPAVALAEAWPGSNPATIDPWRLPGGKAFIWITPTRDGVYLIGSTIIPGFPDDHRLSVALLSIATGQVKEVRKLPDPKFQVLGADADGQWVVWTEGSGQPNFEDWTLFSYDRSSGQVRQLAQAATFQGRPVPTPNVRPQIDHGTIIFSAGTAELPLGSHVDLYQVSPSGGPAEVIAKDARAASFSYPLVVYNAKPGESGPTGGQLMVFDVGTRQARAVDGVTSPTYAALSGDTLVWIGDQGRLLKMRGLADKKDTVIVDLGQDLSIAGYLQFPSINDRIIAWSQTGGTWVYDRKLGERVVLAENQPQGYPLVNGPILQWTEGATKANQDRMSNRVKVLDSRSL